MENATLLLDSEEQKILEYLDIYRPDITELFLRFLPQARKGILHKLVQAVIRENVIAGKYISQEGPRIVVELAEENKLQVLTRQAFSFGRFDTDKVIKLYADGHIQILQHPAELLEILEKEGWIEEGLQYERFHQELQNSVANYALALAGAELRRGALPLLAKSSIEWVEKQMQSVSFSPLSFYEQWVVDGHPLHPGAKIKMGMDVADVIRYSPEWSGNPEVRIAAVHRDSYRTFCMDRKFTEILYEEYPELQEVVKKELEQHGLHEADYELILLHPWQAENTISSLCEKDIAEKRMVWIEGIQIPTAALMSFRSLSPRQDRGEKKHHIKTAVNVQTTGAVRTVSPHSVQNGPMLSTVFREIQEKEQGFQQRFRILEEKAGAHFEPDANIDEEKKLLLRKNTGSLLRENPESYTMEGEIAMPGSALLARSPFSGKTIGEELVEKYAEHKKIASAEQAVLSFLKQYAEVCLPPLLTLMSKYGVSMEGHLQNSVMVFRKGEPMRLLMRDFGGVRILQERLEKQGLKAAFYPGSATIADDVEDTRNKMFYPVLQNHFGELIASFVRHFNISEEEMWKPVAQVCLHTYRELKKEQVVQQQAAADEKALFAPFMDLKAMVKMRLRGDVTDYTFAKVSNPLAAVVKEEKA
ncbi:IucA/IucC family protein [Ectobacillus panaciterrae]|uniref:IucA/IucC family protein n=1 Tax=Ectobacillus panaciterrae TaxID=363872 RepID=UPI0004158493|nr:IucA/IucC family protein [Ectobacillus panaciterrae]